MNSPKNQQGDREINILHKTINIPCLIALVQKLQHFIKQHFPLFIMTLISRLTQISAKYQGYKKRFFSKGQRKIFLKIDRVIGKGFFCKIQEKIHV